MRPRRRPEPKADDRQRRAPAWAIAVNVILILLLGGIAFPVALKVSSGMVFAESRPSVALVWAPNNAIAQASMATRLIPAGRIVDGRRLATDSLRRNPINAAAVRNLAMAAEADDDDAVAQRLFGLANVLSRRDRPTQIWLIRRAFLNGDFEGGIRGFDIAMRTSERAVEYLGPIVVAATADRRTLPSLARALDANPAWRAELLRSLVNAVPDAEHVAWLVRGRLDPSVIEERTTLLVFLDQLVRREQFDLAWSVYDDFAPGGATNPGLRNGGFEHGDGFIPFDWVLADDGDLAGVRGPRPDGRPGTALSLIARDRAGQVARQLVRLTPGRYRVLFETGGTPVSVQDRPRMALSCAAGSQGLGEWQPSNSGDAPQRVSGEVRIPPGCRWQWLTISLNGRGGDDAAVEPWIDNVSVQSIP